MEMVSALVSLLMKKDFHYEIQNIEEDSRGKVDV